MSLFDDSNMYLSTAHPRIGLQSQQCSWCCSVYRPPLIYMEELQGETLGLPRFVSHRQLENLLQGTVSRSAWRSSYGFSVQASVVMGAQEQCHRAPQPQLQRSDLRLLDADHWHDH